MKKTIVMCVLMAFSVISANAQLKVNSVGKVLVGFDNGTNGGTSKLLVGQNTFSGGYRIGTFSDASEDDLYFHYGVIGQASILNASSNGRNFGVVGISGNATSGYNFSLMGVLDGTNNGTALYATNQCYSHTGELISGRYAGYFQGDTKVVGTLTATSVINQSDMRLKKNVVALADDSQEGSALDNVMGMNVLKYNYNENAFMTREEGDTAQSEMQEEAKRNLLKETSKLHYGLSAQELQTIYPALVEECQDGYLGVNYVELVPVLIRAIQELKEELDAAKENNVSRKTHATTTVDAAPKSGNMLFQNTPNPFKELSTIRFSLADDAQNAAICVFDMTGKMLKKLPVSLGMESVSISGYELGEGMFLYSLVINGKEIDTKRMIITK